jgi:3-dehydroquinate synthase
MKISSRVITVEKTPVFFGDDSFIALKQLLKSLHISARRVFIFVDRGTKQYCLPVLYEKAGFLQGATVLEIEGGEQSKSLASAENLWSMLLAEGADRNSLLVNLGGGVISDLGGFVAAGFKRGMPYINIPTSLIGQVDASIGGKTAVNLGNIKNQVGFFYAPSGVVIFPGFLKTLPLEHLRSGFAEIVKIALVMDPPLWQRIRKQSVEKLLKMPSESKTWKELLAKAITIKNAIIRDDYREKKLRKGLNFGHTLGHAFEAYFMAGPGKPLLHGEAVAAGMICAAYLSSCKAGLPMSELLEIKEFIASGFSKFKVTEEVKQGIMDLLIHDKKNQQGGNRFVLITKPGHAKINVSCDENEISEALDFYQE